MFRDCTAEDTGLISHIYATSWRRAYRGMIADHYLDRLPDDYWVTPVRSWLMSGQLSGKLVYDDKCPIGACLYGTGRDEAYQDWGEIVSLYMLPDQTGKGFGSALINACLGDLRKEGFRRFYVWVIDQNEAGKQFYLKHGFRFTSDKITYAIGGETVQDMRMVRVEDQESGV